MIPVWTKAIFPFASAGTLASAASEPSPKSTSAASTGASLGVEIVRGAAAMRSGNDAGSTQLATATSFRQYAGSV